MATIATTTNSTPFEHQTTLLERHAPTGYLYCMVKSSTANQYDLYRSTNNGGSWSLLLSVTRANIVEIGPIRLLDPRYHQLVWCYRTNESSQDRIYLRTISELSLSPPVWNGEYLVAARANGGVAGACFTGMDIAVHVVAGQAVWTVIAAGEVNGGWQGVSLFSHTGPTLAAQATSYSITGASAWSTPGSGRSTPSIEVEHNGDGKTSSTPNLWVAFGRAYLGMVKAAWNGNGWTAPTNMVTIRSDLGGDDAVTGRWDGQRFIMAVPNPTAGATDTVVIHERNRANSTTTNRTTPAHPTGAVRNCTASYNAVTGDVRVYAIGTSTTVLYYIDYIRATGLWSTWTSVLATAVLGAAGDNYGVRRGSYGNARHDVHTAHSGAPNTLTHTSQALSYAPNTPTWVSPQTGAAADVGAGLLLDWDFTDPDVNDTQSAYAISRQVGAGALAYWRASDSTWQAAEVQNTSGTSAVTLPAAWAVHTDAAHTYKVKVWDSASTASGYSAGTVVIPSTPVNPTITAPTAAQVLTTDHVTVTWTVSEQTLYRIQLNVTSGILVYDSGWVANAATRSLTIPYVLGDLTNWTITLNTRNNEGLSSANVTRQFTIDYVEPMVPTLVATPNPSSGWIRVVITNPTPSGGAPTLADQDLYRRVAGSGDPVGVRAGAGLASGATVDDWRGVASGVSYEYRALARGSNGTSIYGAWTA